MSLSAALGTATVYPLQPATAAVAGSLTSSYAAVGVALACGPVGYMFGLVLLVPLVDRFSPRRVLSAQFGVLAAALALSAAVGSVWALAPMTGVIGACSSVGAGLSSVAGRLARPHRRATTLGIVTAGISAGILAGRIAGGWLTDAIGWRGMLLVFAAACVSLGVSSLRVLPNTHGGADRGYLATVRSIPGLVTEYAALRWAAIRGATWFFAFCVVWAGLAVALAQPPYSYSAERIGLYAFAGLLGILATRISGTWTDRVGARKVILAGLALAAAATAVLAFALPNTAVTLACLALFDAGLFAAQVANQSTVLAIDPSAPARFNSAYMIVYFVGGSIGTAFGAAAVDWVGWPATAGITVTAIAAAALITVRVAAPGPASCRAGSAHSPTVPACPRSGR
ncbi:putative MFS family arabinose efflux permease [Herbihabitans rhizosphaerae]|uniref:Putative MFS family arabinose efflux permease n=1 Tax=Herbihabitans rhizosphaerae TaxID=1872711 RepID=A0A4Q7KV90_9PSEU|nr:MFS transporter [Herbihabitans rhizosphaerae]RZS40919.1 putative MFS family arabinose efflux permease [Herbihabitans rhizosphaerae]